MLCYYMYLFLVGFVVACRCLFLDMQMLMEFLRVCLDCASGGAFCRCGWWYVVLVLVLVYSSVFVFWSSLV